MRRANRGRHGLSAGQPSTTRGAVPLGVAATFARPRLSAVLGCLIALGLVMPALGADASTPSIGAPNTTPGAVWGWGDADLFGAGGMALARAPGLSDVISLAVGQGDGVADTGYALREDGTVWAWGAGAGGELGNGTLAMYPSAIPVRVRGLSDVVEVAGTYAGGYALEKDGSVWAWGMSSAGELGNGTDAGISDIPVRVHDLSNADAIAGGGSDAGDGYAALRDGTVWAWGAGSDGQLGNGALGLSDVPVKVHGLADAVSVAASAEDGYAVLKNGTVWAWGANNRGQLGDGTQGLSSDVPVQVHGLSDVAAVAAGVDSDSLIALRKDGTVWHWGAVANFRSSANNDIPVEVHGLSHVVAITGGYYTEFAILGNGTVWGWGDEEDGELGNGVHTYATAPLMVRGLRGVVAMAGGVAEEFAVVAPPKS
ncbi:MAG: RCC1 domain-containing protein [Acidimicrobiales bacterium]